MYFDDVSAPVRSNSNNCGYFKQINTLDTFICEYVYQLIVFTNRYVFPLASNIIFLYDQLYLHYIAYIDLESFDQCTSDENIFRLKNLQQNVF